MTGSSTDPQPHATFLGVHPQPKALLPAEVADGSRHTAPAAGVVLWRDTGAQTPEIAIVHRPKYDDWSLPKGKLDRGETAACAAVREAHEETGYRCRLGRYLGQVRYPMPGNRKTKRVDYWAATPTAGEFRVNAEVDILRWVSVAEAHAALSYRSDKDVLQSFLSVRPDTRTVLLVRHAKAGRPERFTEADELRPLDRAGRAHARALAAELLAFGVAHVHAAPPLRCVQTVAPLAGRLGVTIVLEPSLSVAGYASNPAVGLGRVRELARTAPISVICSQGPVIPHLLQCWADRDRLELPPARNRKGSVWILSVHSGRLVAADHRDVSGVWQRSS